MIVGWLGVDNVKLLAKYWLGAWLIGKAKGTDTEIELTTGGFK